MSHNPPYGPPPPYYTGQGHPPPPPPGGFAYVPAPVMMPVYQPPPPPPPPEVTAPPTYVTNYIYQQPPQPQPVIVEEITIQQQPSNPWSNVLSTAEKGLATVGKGLALLETGLRNRNSNIEWVPATTGDVGSLSHKAFVAGREAWDGSPLCVIRAHHSGEFLPGKLAIKHRAAYVPYGGREVPVHNFEVLCVPSHAVRWLHSSNGQVPVGAIAAGNTHSGEPLYIGRVRHMQSLTPGKVHPSHGCCYISFGGSEHTHKTYEVLCRIVG
ncbi:uncharacterized protein LOC110380542 isoform X1 [Helicoverpa armigera]|uniref:uncharacterized protein LOC110380542 isoform X1 n=1 Tax=Helicoverpa armigera TaxID=29058 RepID=UPI000B36AE2A|nr:uncharacterized protein LOC110380542 [Helicoverpa armigera]XP_049693233.1 uncharacterized protein LOC110380542 [Helicoverpa armigera]PZC86148.1 hypothetical protein B5X24_HaOG213106 [Helicoverpa armigera]